MKAAKEIPDGFMDLLPSASTYYTRVLPDLSRADVNGWADAECPLHRYPEGHRVRVDLLTGRFVCSVCGRGDLLLFDMLRTGDGFKATVLRLIDKGI